MKNFEELKNEWIEIAKKYDACGVNSYPHDQVYKKLLDTSTEKDIDSMKNFEELKSEWIEIAKKYNACGVKSNPHDKVYKKLLDTSTEIELVELIRDNFDWCYGHLKMDIITPLLNFNSESLNDCGIWINRKENIDLKNCCVVISYGSSKICYVISNDSSLINIWIVP